MRRRHAMGGDDVRSGDDEAPERVDAALEAVVASFERAVPGRIRGYYLHGSAGDNTRIATSDVDLDVVVKGAFRDPSERDALSEIARSRG